MKSWSIPAGRLLGADFRIHVTFLALLLPIWMMQPRSQSTYDVIRGLALIAIILASAAIHEAAHALAAIRDGIAVRSIVLLPIGGVSILGEAPAGAAKPRARQQIRIAAAGPAISFAVAIAAAALAKAVMPGVNLGARPWLHSSDLLRSLVWTNLFLGLFNLLPAFPLDGGRVLRAILSERMDYLRATRRAVNIGQGFVIGFFLLGMYNLSSRPWGAWFVVVGFFVFVAAQLEERTLEFQAVLENVRMEDVMLTDFSTLSPSDTLEYALLKAVHSLQDDFPVVRGSDMVGVISRQKILDALRLGGNAYVQSVMNSAYDIAQRTETLAAAFRKITAKNVSIIPVVEGEHLVGIVTLQNLMHSMGMLAESRKLQRATEEQV